MRKVRNGIAAKLRSNWEEKLEDEHIQAQLNLYVPAMLGHTEKDEVDNRLDGLTEVEEFLHSENKVMLLLGDSGAGKSLFCQWLVAHLWEDDKDVIPLYIHLPLLTDYNDFLTKHFEKIGYSSDEIDWFKENAKMVLVLDAFDEMKKCQKDKNVYRIGKLYQWKQIKVIITCRTEELAKHSHNVVDTLFAPHENNVRKLEGKLKKRYVQVFDPKTQIPAFVKRWIALYPDSVDHEIDYLHIINSIPNIADMITNPFILWIVMETLPSLLKEGFNLNDLQKVQITRLELFKVFTERWFERQRDKLLNNDLIGDVWRETIVQDFRSYCEQLADRMWQTGNNTVQYTQKSQVTAVYSSSRKSPPGISYGSEEWRDFFDPYGFFNNNPKKPLRILKQGALLSIEKGSVYSFLHASLLEYFSSSRLFASAIHKTTIPLGLEINGQLFTDDPARVRLGADCVRTNPEFEKALWEIIKESKTDRRVEVAAANAMTILTAANRTFAGRDLTRVRIRGSNVSGGNFDSSNLEGADLRDVNISQAYLSHANLSGCFLDGLQTGELFGETYDYEVVDCAFSKDGKFYGVLTKASLHIYNTQSHKLTKRIKPLNGKNHNELTCFSLNSRGSEVLLGANNGEILRMCITTRKLLNSWKAHKSPISSLIFSPDGTWCLSMADIVIIKRWEVNSGQCMTTFKMDMVPPYGLSLSSNLLTLSPNGKWVFTIAAFDKKVTRWDAKNGNCISSYQSPSTARGGTLSLVVNNESKWFLSADGSFASSKIERWDIESNRLLNSWNLNAGGHVTSLLLSPCEKWVFVTSGVSASIKQYTINGQYITTWECHPSPVTSLALSPDSDWVLSSDGSKSIKRFHVTSRQNIRFSEEISFENMVLDNVIVSDKKQVILYCLTGIIRCNIFNDSIPVNLFDRKYFIDVRLNSNGKTFYSNDGHIDFTIFKISLWDIESSQCLHTWTYDKRIMGFRDWIFSTNNKWIILIEDNNIIRLDFKNSKLVLKWTAQEHEKNIRLLLLSPDEKSFFSSSADKTIKHWDVDTGQCLATWHGHTDSVSTLAFSLNGQWILSGSKDTTIKRWNVNTGHCLSTWKGHSGSVNTLAFSPNGKWVISGGDDGYAILWDFGNNALIRIYNVTYTIEKAQWSKSKLSTNIITIQMRNDSFSVWQFDQHTLTLHLLWSTKPWNLQALNSTMLGVYGLSELDERTLREKGAQVQVSSKKTEDVLAKEDEIDIPYDSFEMPLRSMCNKTLILSPEMWAVSIARKKEGGGDKHASLILESVEEGFYLRRQIDFFIDQRYKSISNQFNSTRDGHFFWKAHIEMMLKPLSDMENLVSLCCFRSAGITPKQGLQLLKNIRKDQEKTIGYSLPGSGNIYGIFRIKEAAEHHNCMSWCEKQLELIDVKLTEQHWTDGLANNPRHKLKAEGPLRKSPRFNFRKGSVENSTESPNTKCVLM